MPKIESFDLEKHWIVMPDEVEAKVLEWRERHGDIVSVESVRSYVGLPVYAVTVTDLTTPSEGKRKLVVHVPHAHEPGATAGCMDFLNALIEGAHLAGRPFGLDRRRVLEGALITIIPVANPDGRSRAPVRFWDGSRYTNDEFWCFMRGKDRATGKPWKRLGHWSTRVETDYPDPVGIVYEQVSPHEYVEPNRTTLSSLYKLIASHRARHEYDLILSVHQTEFVNSENNCMVILPCLQDELPAAVQARNKAVGEAILAAWVEAGGRPLTEIKPLGYTGEQRQYFIDTWRDLYEVSSCATIEVQNNNPRTSPEQQMQLCETGIRAAVAHLVGAG